MANFFERLFGVSITKNNVEKQKPSEKTFVAPENQDGAMIVQAGGHFGVFVDLDGSHQNDIDLVNRYREMALTAELDMAITTILDEAIVSEDSGKTVSLNMDDLKKPASFKNKIADEFENVLRLLNFNQSGHEIFRRWYVDGRLYYHIIIDENAKSKGISEVRYIDPRKIRKVRQIEKTRDSKTGLDIIKSSKEYYLFNERGIIGAYSNLGAKIEPDSIAYITSGIVDPTKNQVLGHLQKAIKPLNNLRMVEDATVIYRLSRAPERRVFYIDVGSMPVQKAEAYLKAQQNKFRNKIVYDATTGEIRDEKKHMCLDMNTKVPLLDGRTLTLTEIASEYKNKDLWVYSCDPITGEFKPGLITWAGVARKNSEVMKLTLDNGKTIVCTLDHKFPVWNNGLVQAQNLKIGDLFFSLDIKNPKFTDDVRTLKKIEFLDEKIDTGCLTIDGNEIYHNYHTFALDAGVYTQNSMIEDFWIPRMSGNRNSEITTLPGGQTLGQIEDVQYMQDKLYKALNIPFSRIRNESSGFSLGRTTEITRDEIAFSKFIQRLRKKFSDLFIDLLKKQLILKGIIKEDEWDDIVECIWFDFIKDVNFEELKEAELLRERVITLQQIDPYVGRYFSLEWVRKNVLKQTDEEIDELSKQIEQEKKEGLIMDPMEMQQNQPPPIQPDMFGNNSGFDNLNNQMQNNGEDDYSRFTPQSEQA